MIGLILMATMSTASAPSVPTLGQWAQQESSSRRLSMVGAMEGVLLASSGPKGATVPIDADCFAAQTPDSLEKALLEKARTSPGIRLAQALLNVGQCSRKVVQ